MPNFICLEGFFLFCRSLVFRDLHLQDHGIERRDPDMQRTGNFLVAERQDLEKEGLTTPSQQRQAAGTGN